MNTTTETVNTTAKPTGKKLSATLVRMSELLVGQSIKGKLIKETVRTMLDKETGEEREVPQYLFEGSNGRFFVLADKGLKNAMLAAGVTAKDSIEVVKLSPAELPNGNRVTQYEIYGL